MSNWLRLIVVKSPAALASNELVANAAARRIFECFMAIPFKKAGV
jgi:hypothetical protein